NLVDLLGGYERRTSTLVNHYLDTRSVLLLKEEIGEKWEGNVEFLNLSPFIIDENAFKGRADSTVPEIMFFHHYDRERDSYFFQRVQKPDDPMLEAREDNKLQVVKIQFDAFRTILTQQ
ncbi:MAG: hypothetical protein KDD06_30115, partial [Phaeodactylibacter sp.]|nr:hypothetical protein [Phaeodactylibacter sp.]